MVKKIETPAELAGVNLKPAKISFDSEGEPFPVGPHVLELKCTHTGRADKITSYLGAVGCELLAVRIEPPEGGMEKWTGFARIGPRSIKPSTAEDGAPVVSFTLKVEAEKASDLEELFHLRAVMADAGLVLVKLFLAPTQEDLPFSG